MGQVINTNIASLNAQRNLNTSQSALNTSLQRLSSGMRINSAKDDAAGLAITERFTSQIRGLNQAQRNASDGISLAQTAEGDLAVITNNLQRIRELSVQSANATNSASDRAALQLEVTELVSEIDRVSGSSAFNGVKLLDGTFTAQDFQVGANVGEVVSISSISSARADSLGQTFVAETTGGAVTAGAITDLSINGSGSISSDADAATLAAAINTASIEGVTAEANSLTVAGGTVAGTNEVGKIDINGTNTAEITLTGVAGDNATSIAQAINDISADTGVTAVVNAGKIDLTSADGSNIAVDVTTTGNLTTAVTGLAETTTYSTVTVTSANEDNLVITGGATSGLSGEHTAALTGTTLEATTIATVDGAKAAIATVDAALNTINTSRASLGAVQNRFESVVTSIQTTSENLSAARSRIRDTDFAAETASLTKAQILQQAGVAMLSQANSLPQNVLSLLQ